MAIDNTGVSQNAEFGLINASTWHTAVALSGAAMVDVDGLTGLAPQIQMIQDVSIGKPFPKHIDQGNREIEFAISGRLRYRSNLWIPIFQLIGTDIGSVATGVYTHYADMADFVSGRFFTAAAIIRSTAAQLYEWPTVKTSKVELSANGNDGFMKFNITGIADDVKIGADGTNDSDNFPGGSPGSTFVVTQATGTLLVPFTKYRINMNAASGADWNSSGDGSDRVFPTAITISIARPLVRDFLADRTTANAQAFLTAEPRIDGIQSDILVTLEFSETEARTAFEDFQDGTAKKMEIYFYHNASNTIKLQFPRLVPLQPTYNIDKIGRIPSTLVYQAIEAEAAPTGMTAITSPLRLTVVNGDSKCYHDGSTIT
jgi:hypothetical protein